MKKSYGVAFLGLVMSVGSAWGFQPQQSQDSSDSAQAQSQTQNNDETQAQTRRGRMRRGAQARRSMSALAQKLNLTDDQKSQFQKIRQSTMQQAKAIRVDSSLNDEQKKQKIAELRKQSHQQMFGVLTPEQKEQLKQMREERKKQTEGSDGSAKQSSAKKAVSDDDDPFAGMTSDDDDGGRV